MTLFQIATTRAPDIHLDVGGTPGRPYCDPIPQEDPEWVSALKSGDYSCVVVKIKVKELKVHPKMSRLEGIVKPTWCNSLGFLG